METTVEKLEAMFLKSEADLEYIEKRLKLDFINNTAENGRPAEENPAVMLENLRAIKAKHTELCSQVKEIAAAQKESMDSIRNNLGSVMEMIQHFQQTTDIEVQPVSESVQGSAELLGIAGETTAEMASAAAASGQQHPHGGEYDELSEAMFEAVPRSIRSNIKLADLNLFYQQLQQHFSQSNSTLTVQKMKQMKMKVSDANLKVLQHLSVVELDRRGHFHLVI